MSVILAFFTAASSLLSPFSLFTLIALIASFNYIKGHHRRRLLSKLPSPPGKLPILGHLLRLRKAGQTATESVFTEFIDNARQFSKEGLFYLKLGSSDIVHVYSPDAFQQIMSSSEHATKPSSYDPVKEWVGNGLATSNGAQWRHDRKLLTPAFHFKILEQYNSAIDSHANILCGVISKTGGNVHDLYKVLCVATLDTIGETAFGINFNMQSNASLDNVYATNLDKFIKLVIRRVFNPFLHSDFLYALVLPSDKREGTEAVKKLHKFTNDIISTRKMERTSLGELEGDTTKSKLKSLLDILLDVHMNDQMSLADIRAQLDTFTFAGHDTTAVAMTFSLLAIANNVHVQNRIHSELDDVLGTGNVLISEHLKNLKYLEMVINESLRLYPPVPFIARVIKQEVTIGDYVIPANMEVWLNIKALHQNEEIFPDPETFDPERFSDEQVKGRHPFAFTPFSGGLRNCIGQRYAMNSMKVILGTLLKNFKISPITKCSDVRLTMELTMRSLHPIAVKFDKRF